MGGVERGGVEWEGWRGVGNDIGIRASGVLMWTQRKWKGF